MLMCFCLLLLFYLLLNSFFIFFFFLMIRRPPRSTLFPYTTALPIYVDGHDQWLFRAAEAQPAWLHGAQDRSGMDHRSRSEEHTSELQSPYDLVCRLLLEKKKIKQQIKI